MVVYMQLTEKNMSLRVRLYCGSACHDVCLRLPQMACPTTNVNKFKLLIDFVWLFTVLLIDFVWLFTDMMSFRCSLVPRPPAGAHTAG